MPATMGRNAEGKRRTAEICFQWELSPSDGINVFPMKSARVNDPSFDMHPKEPTYEDIVAFAYKAPLNSDGIAVLPADWDE